MKYAQKQKTKSVHDVTFKKMEKKHRLYIIGWY